VGTRGYVRQRRVITLNNAGPEESPRAFVPTDADCGVIEKAENAGDTSIDSISCPLGSLPYGVE